ncbi:uncharacterized protein OCT59_024680 [Rhizophagus irregularis]|nr:hypothetical protein OCT59_024680 [Rhizophagus irregularis]GET57772.1 hypothetical protein GLOIN_2v1885892 [Rhizophagus irregularis DAOM 181602=DAOM 197198]
MMVILLKEMVSYRPVVPIAVNTWFFLSNNQSLNYLDLCDYWCIPAVQLPWENPFSLKDPKNYYYVGVYLYNLSDDRYKNAIKGIWN